MRSSHALNRWIIQEVTGRDIGRKPVKRALAYRGPARDYRYRAWIRSLPSAVSGQLGCEAAHTGGDGGMRQKSSDFSCVPLTRSEHAELHGIGKQDFEAKYGIEFKEVVRRLSDAWFAHAAEVK